MTKNFDEGRQERLARQRSFTIGGETFTYKASVAPEVYLDWSKMVGGEYGDELTEVKSIEIFDATIVGFLEPGQEEKWQKVRAIDAEFPLTLADMKDVVRYLFEENSGRPTGPSSDSSGGSRTAQTATTSKADEPSPAEPVSTT